MTSDICVVFNLTTLPANEPGYSQVEHHTEVRGHTALNDLAVQSELVLVISEYGGAQHEMVWVQLLGAVILSTEKKCMYYKYRLQTKLKNRANGQLIFLFKQV